MGKQTKRCDQCVNDQKKCNNQKPTCDNCTKKNRNCTWNKRSTAEAAAATKAASRPTRRSRAARAPQPAVTAAGSAPLAAAPQPAVVSVPAMPAIPALPALPAPPAPTITSASTPATQVNNVNDDFMSNIDPALFLPLPGSQAAVPQLPNLPWLPTAQAPVVSSPPPMVVTSQGEPLPDWAMSDILVPLIPSPPRPANLFDQALAAFAEDFGRVSGLNTVSDPNSTPIDRELTVVDTAGPPMDQALSPGLPPSRKRSASKAFDAPESDSEESGREPKRARLENGVPNNVPDELPQAAVAAECAPPMPPSTFKSMKAKESPSNKRSSTERSVLGPRHLIVLGRHRVEKAGRAAGVASQKAKVYSKLRHWLQTTPGAIELGQESQTLDPRHLEESSQIPPTPVTESLVLLEVFQRRLSALTDLISRRPRINFGPTLDELDADEVQRRRAGEADRFQGLVEDIVTTIAAVCENLDGTESQNAASTSESYWAEVRETRHASVVANALISLRVRGIALPSSTNDFARLVGQCDIETVESPEDQAFISGFVTVYGAQDDDEQIEGTTATSDMSDHDMLELLQEQEEEDQRFQPFGELDRTWNVMEWDSS